MRTSIIKATISILLCGMFLIACNNKPKENQSETDWLKNAIEVSDYQLKMLAKESDAANRDSLQIPRSIKNGEIYFVNAYDWTSGFFPGMLWYGYELTGDEQLKTEARKYTDKLEVLQNYKDTHDLGFMIFCSYGNAKRLAPNVGDSAVIVNTAKSLASRFSPKVGLIRSWDFGKWSYPVIIDNMMNLEMLFEASKMTGDTIYRHIAISHADKTMKNHYRDDMSTWHVVSYNPENGEVESKGTHQGFSDESAWARGQAWGLYGYTMCYKETGEKRYLERAEAIAKYIMNNPNTPDDLIPYWDYNSPEIPNAKRDASAAAIISSALFDLSTLASDGNKYFDYAERMLKTLSSDKYLAKKGENNGFVLLHAVGHHPEGSEVDTSINYGDYYYLEAIKRYAGLKQIETKSLLKSE